jgi:glycosyltransferase 2 family protein
VARQPQRGWHSATYSVLVNRAIGLIALAVLVVFSLPWSFELIHNDRGRLALVLVDFAAISAGLGFLPFAVAMAHISCLLGYP